MKFIFLDVDGVLHALGANHLPVGTPVEALLARDDLATELACNTLSDLATEATEDCNVTRFAGDPAEGGKRTVDDDQTRRTYEAYTALPGEFCAVNLQRLQRLVREASGMSGVPKKDAVPENSDIVSKENKAATQSVVVKKETAALQSDVAKKDKAAIQSDVQESVRIVITSTWREKPWSFQCVDRELAKYGLEIFGATPILAGADVRKRPREVALWLETNLSKTLTYCNEYSSFSVSGVGSAIAAGARNVSHNIKSQSGRHLFQAVQNDNNTKLPQNDTNTKLIHSDRQADDELFSYVVLDDADLVAYSREQSPCFDLDRFVRVDMERGLTDENVEMALKILREPVHRK